MTDLSAGAAQAVRRAALLTKSLGAHLTLLHPLGAELPADRFERSAREIDSRLKVQRWSMAHVNGVTPSILVRAGHLLQAVDSALEGSRADLIVLGRNGNVANPDVTRTVSALMHLTGEPILLVNREPQGDYRNVLLAVDLSEASGRMIRWTASRGLLDGADVSVVHAFRIPYQGMVAHVGIGKDPLRRYSQGWREARLGELVSHIGSCGVDPAGLQISLRNAEPIRAIRQAIQRHHPDLLVLGTKAYRGLKRALFGSVAEQVLRERACDILIVPPPLSRNALMLPAEPTMN